MNTIYPYASHAMEVSTGMFRQGYQSLQGWGERAVLYLQSIPQTLAQNPNALITTIFAANALFLIVLNKAINSIEKRFTDEEPRSWTILVISETFATASIVGFNLLVSKATKTQMTQQTIAAITATALFVRILFNYMRSPAQLPAEPQEKQKTAPKQAKLDPEILEEAVPEQQEARSPQEIRTAALLKKELAAEQTKAAQLHLDNCKLNERIADVELQLSDLVDAVAAKDEANKKLQSLEREVEDERAAMKKENVQLKAAQAKAEHDLAEEKDRSKSEIDALQKTIAALKDEKAQTEKLQKKADADFTKAQNTHEATVKSYIAEKEAALKEKDQALQEKSEAESALQEIRKKNKQLTAEKALFHKRIEELEATLSAKDPASKTPGNKVPPTTPQDPNKSHLLDKKTDSPNTIGNRLFM